MTTLDLAKLYSNGQERTLGCVGRGGLMSMFLPPEHRASPQPQEIQPPEKEERGFFLCVCFFVFVFPQRGLI